MFDNNYLGSPEKEYAFRPIYSRKGRPSVDDSAIDKVKQLFDFLETIESKADSFKSTHTFIENEMKSIESKEKEVIESYSEGRSKLLSMKIELEEANSLIQTLKKNIEKEKAKNIEIEEKWKKRMDEKLLEQRKELEDVVKQHLDFIDQLVNDKKELGEQCEELIERLKDCEAKNARQVADLKEKYQREAKNNKEVWMASEKQKREKWIKEKTNEIKEITIKGLEPEIDRIMNKGKDDVKKVEDKYRGEISRLKEELHWEYEEKLKQYKEKSLRENDEKIEKERIYMDQKMKEQYEKMERRIGEEREKMKEAYEKKMEEQEKEKTKTILQLREKIRKLEDDNKRA